jgi:hypothetical protein
MAGEIGELGLLTEAVEAVRNKATDALGQRLDALDEAFARVGVESVTGGLRHRPVPGVQAQMPECAWVCPGRICPRSEAATDAAGSPICAVMGLPLIRVRMGA